MQAPVRLPVPPGTKGGSAPLWLTTCHVVDVGTGRISRNVNVKISDGQIAEVTTEPPSSSDNIIDLGGRFLSPGLISVHTHLSVVYPFSDIDEGESPGLTTLRALARAQEALRAGITTIRCVHEQNRADLLIRAAADQGWVEAPRIVGAGRAISATGGHGHGMACVYADGFDAFLQAARTELAAGADHIKVFITGGIARQGENMLGSEMTMDEMRAVVRAAQERGRYVVAHASEGSAILEALKAGVRCFEHAYEIDDNVVSEMARRQVFLTPTLCVDRCPEWMADHGFTKWQIQRAMEVGPSHLASIRRAVSGGLGSDERPGITFLAGTDYPPGEPIEDTVVAVREMEFLTDAGLSPLQALQAGTANAARLIGMGDQIGAVEVGRIADLVSTQGDPTSDVAALRHIDLVLQAGRIVRNDLSAEPTSAPAPLAPTGASL